MTKRMAGGVVYANGPRMEKHRPWLPLLGPAESACICCNVIALRRHLAASLHLLQAATAMSGSFPERNSGTP